MRPRAFAGSIAHVYGMHCVMTSLIVCLGLGLVTLLFLWGGGHLNERLFGQPWARAWRRRRALRREAEGLARGRWLFLDEAHRLVGEASIARALEPAVKLVERAHAAERGFVIGHGPEGEVRLVHEGDERFVEVAGRALAVSDWVHECFERARLSWLGGATSTGYRATSALPTWLTLTLPDADPLTRLAASPLPYRVPPEHAKGYQAIFEAWKERRTRAFSDDDARARFPEHDEASSWEVIGEPFEPDGMDDPNLEEPFLLRTPTGRVVSLCFDEVEPWVRVEHPSVETFLRLEVIVPHAKASLMGLESRATAAAVLSGG